MRCNPSGFPFLALMCVVLTAASGFASSLACAQADAVLRVCSDPNNMPLSNERGEGYENKIAQELARDLGRKVEYTWFPQRIGFVRHTLKEQDEATREYKCDVIIGVPAGYELTATTRPYMHSTYALVYAARSDFDGMQSADDLLKLPPEKLQALRIGVFSRSPGTDWLLRNNLLERAAVYTHQSGDPAETPGGVIERELAAGKIDLAIVWGPIAGLLVREHSAFPAWNAVPFKPDPQIQFDYKISMGVRFGEKEWKATLDEWIAAHRDKVDAILASYGIPVVDDSGNVTARFRSAEQARAGAVPKTIPLKLEPQ
ncbi:MAG TPA: quinoprotein dehydrogenase-associated putative ABC transporter substrate-binding protein [Povalibacter sp.]|nr:quinoprotein dehydrogenase-associated putative ABC transporter substrate-binding protein [Povalibacter sp.]